MVLKIFKAFWFLSMLTTLAILLINYISLPETVAIQENGVSQVAVGKELFFYLAMALLGFINLLVFIIAKLYAKQTDFRTWFYGLIITFNIFFIIATSFLNVYNSSEKYNYNNIAFAVYGSLALIITWAVAWPIYSVYIKFFPKQSISDV
ncbi:MAG TPA: hypothetical protein PLS08_07150 [Chryseolinea sp.]|nr:hypothetical protein [Chryseolinea sp.]